MRASSAASYEAGLEVMLASLKGDQGEKVSDELFGLTDLLGDNISLSRALTEPARSAQDKQNLARKVLGDQACEPTLKVVEELVSGRWSSELDLADSTEQLGIRALLEAAVNAGNLDAVEKELFELRKFLKQNRQVRNALTDRRGYSAQARKQLSRDLFAQQLHPVTMKLLERVVGHVAAGRLLAELRELALTCAQLRNRDLVTVACATQPTKAQLEKLTKLLSQRAGRELTINVTIDPSLIGGMQIRTGSSRIDGSLLSNLTNVRRQLAS